MHGLTTAQMQRRREAGFSLLEVTLVVAIALVVMGISITALMPTLDSYRIEGDAQGIAGLIALARMRATTNFGHASLLCSATLPYSCQVQVTTAGSVTAIAEPLRKMLSAGISFTTFGTGAPTLGAGNQVTPTQNMTMTFNSRGLPIDAGGNLVSDYAIYLVSAGGRYCAVALQANGQPAIYTWLNGAWNLTQ
jgi:Tfp pilus assembly protein FimT